MPYLQHPDFKLHYTSEGRGETAIVLLHGNFGSQRHWSLFCDNLHPSFSAYAIDFRGCGDSEAPKTGYDIETLSEDVFFFINEIGLTSFHLVGHSLGGAVAQQFAATYPKHILSLTLVAPAPAEGLASLQKDGFIHNLFSPTKTFEAISKFGLAKLTLTATFKKTMPSIKSNIELIGMLVDDAIKMDPKALHGFYDTLKSWNGLALLKKLNFPVLIIHGGLDKVVEAMPIERMANAISDCRLSQWRNVGHAPQLEKPDAFKHLVDNFILGSTISSIPETTTPVKEVGVFASIKGWLHKLFSKTG